MVGVPALLELARWCRRRRHTVCGANLCATSRMTSEPPPAPSDAAAAGPPQGLLEGPAGRDASADAVVAEPDTVAAEHLALRHQLNVLQRSV